MTHVNRLRCWMNPRWSLTVTRFKLTVWRRLVGWTNPSRTPTLTHFNLQCNTDLKGDWTHHRHWLWHILTCSLTQSHRLNKHGYGQWHIPTYSMTQAHSLIKLSAFCGCYAPWGPARGAKGAMPPWALQGMPRVLGPCKGCQGCCAPGAPRGMPTCDWCCCSLEPGLQVRIFKMFPFFLSVF